MRAVLTFLNFPISQFPNYHLLYLSAVKRIIRPAAVCFLLLLRANTWSQQGAPAGKAPAYESHAVPVPTWRAPETDVTGKLTAAQIRALPDAVFAFPRIRKEPLTDAAHVRSAIARFSQVKGATDEDRDLAFANIKKAANYFGVRVKADNWRQLGIQH